MINPTSHARNEAHLSGKKQAALKKKITKPNHVPKPFDSAENLST
jgi:hypothetical protein